MPKSTENTVFVRFVPTPHQKVMRHQLEDIFSQIGPIKKSSWINSKSASYSAPEGGNDNNKTVDSREEGPATTNNNNNSKGYGFVKYVARDDAEAATKDLNNSKIQMDGQDYTLKVELASLPSMSKAKTNNADGGRPSSQTVVAISRNNDDNSGRKINMPHDSNKKTVSAPTKGTSQDATTRPSNLTATTTAEMDASLLKKKSRIIVRNLSFYAKESHIRKAMEENFGKVSDIHLPNVEGSLHVGFCFVTFENPMDAQKAVESKRVDISKRTANLDWSLPKKLHQQQQKLHPKVEEKNTKPKQAVNQNDPESNVDEDDAEEEEDEIRKDDFSDGHDEGDDDSEDGSSQSDVEDDGVDNDEIDEDSDKDEEGDDDETPADDSVGRRCTLFLRNLPFDSTRHDLFQLFLKFGHIKGIYLVKDRDTGMLKGTAFVTFTKPESAARAMDYAATSGTGDGVNAFVSQKAGAGNSAIAGGDGLVNTKGSLLLKGRKILVDLAVDKETAATFDSQETKIPSADRRNLYLQAEARVESSSTDPKADNSNTWEDLPLQDQKKRQTALKDKTTKLHSPIFFINPMRLSFRNMGKHVDEMGLQKLIELAVKRGLEKRLVGAKDQIAHWRALGEMSTRDILAKVQMMESKGEDVIPAWDDKRNIKEYIPSVYIDRDFGPTGKKSDAPSRGFGFAEFTHHAHALACLKELNNNPAYCRDYAAGGKAADALRMRPRRVKKAAGGKGVPAGSGAGEYLGEDGRVHLPRLIVDFTVENKIKAKKQADRRLHQQLNQSKQQLERLEKKENHYGDDKADTTEKKRSRGSLQREKKKLRIESGEEEAERKAKLEAKALFEAKKELQKQRREQKKQRLEEIKSKTVKAPKKKKPTMDLDDEKFESIVRSYTSKIESTREQKEEQQHNNPRVAVKEKRWFE
jgi:nucleolar protein 4